MKSLDRISLEEQARLVSRYVAGDLSRSERADFEAWLIASPELAAEVEMERRLRRGIASAARRGWLKRGVQGPVAPDRRWQAALAATVLLSVAVGLSLTLPTSNTEPQIVAETARQVLKPVAASLTFRLGSVRGVGGSPDITLARAEAPGQLVIEPDVVVLTCEDGALELECPGGNAPLTPQYPEYQMEVVSREDNALVWRSAASIPTAGSPLSFAMPNPGSLDAGNYEILVRGNSLDHTEVVGRFSLRITR